MAEMANYKEDLMLTLSATQFVNNFGQRNQEVQLEPIEVKSHGRTVGFYVSPTEYRKMQDALKRISEPGAYTSIKGRVHALKDEILKISRKYGVIRIRLFDSVALSKDKPQSDIDFLLEYPEGHVFCFDDLGLSGELEDLFDGRKVDVVSLDKIDHRLKESILEGAIDI